MRATLTLLLGVSLLAGMALAVDYKENTIGGGSYRSTSSVSTSSGTASSESASSSSLFGTMNFGEFIPDNRTLDERIETAESRLNHLYFIRDVCTNLESDIAISFEEMEIRDVLKKTGELLGVQLPHEVPEGEFLVEESNVAGMPADRFLDAVARTCGLRLIYQPKKLVFVRQEKTSAPNNAIERTDVRGTPAAGESK